MSGHEILDIDPDKLFRKHYTFPALPTVINEIHKTIHSQNISIKKFANLISQDPVLVAQILKSS